MNDTLIAISVISTNVLVGVLALLQYLTRHDVKEVKHATNSLQDKLVDATQLAAEAKGRDEERAKQEQI